jgi:FixJ family two-component response regulator/anti-sigma regulatory factor (Ser/Thr protein kinase)
MNIKFNYFCDSDNKSVFLKGDPSVFGRMISNLLNNAIESFDGNAGVIDVIIKVEEPYFRIIIKDNGKGMLPEHVEKIRKNISFSSGKKFGHGIGLNQVRGAVDLFSGQLSVESEKKAGTRITIVFPMSDKPNWAINKLTINEDSIVVVLDDDLSMRHAWSFCLEKYSNRLSMEFFTKGKDVIEFVESSKNPEKIFLLCDYELRNQEMNGAQVVERLGMNNRAVIITSNCNSKEIQSFAEKAGIPLLQKTSVSSLEVVINEKAFSVDLVIIDDNIELSESLAEFFRNEGLSVDIYRCPFAFKSQLFKYNTNVKILTDNDFRNDRMDGLELIKQLHDLGYSKLYMISGKNFSKDSVPRYLKVLLKGNIKDLRLLLNNTKSIY